ncbi:MAG: hypothetical protein DWQ01_03485 [Planctomycetota bacterium]|nr:MAG: hypothetical protein DWQ01_03485 [Planctomycetota bacterium]
MTLPDPAAFRNALPSEGRLILCTHRHPDPDGLGAMVGIQYLLKKRFELDCDLVLEGRIRRAENVAMRQLLEIQAVPKGGINPADYHGLLVVDSQPGFTHTNPPGALPILGVIDHHQGSEESAAVAETVPFFWVAPHYGATSTMVYDLLCAFGVRPDRRAATALFCGIRYDTNNLVRDSTTFDERAYYDLERVADRKLIAAIDQPPLSRAYFAQMGEAIRRCRIFGTTLLTLMDEVTSPEMVAEVADWFVRLEGPQWSLAGGACDGRYQLSLRTDMPGADAYPALRGIIGKEGSCGGHGRMAGGQIPLTELDLKAVQRLVQHRAMEVFEVEETQYQVLDPGGENGNGGD